MVCPATDKICNDRECKDFGCLEQREDEGEDAKDKDANA